MATGPLEDPEQVSDPEGFPGVHVSDGDPTAGGILGAKVPELNNPEWRWFYTQQHGDNLTYEVALDH